jgi:hypothetical protein
VGPLEPPATDHQRDQGGRHELADGSPPTAAGVGLSGGQPRLGPGLRGALGRTVRGGGPVPGTGGIGPAQRQGGRTSGDRASGWGRVFGHRPRRWGVRGFSGRKLDWGGFRARLVTRSRRQGRPVGARLRRGRLGGGGLGSGSLGRRSPGGWCLGRGGGGSRRRRAGCGRCRVGPSGQQPGSGRLPCLRLRIGGQRQNEVCPPARGTGERLGQLEPASSKTLSARTMEIVRLLPRLGLRTEQPFRSSQPIRHAEDGVG